MNDKNYQQFGDFNTNYQQPSNIPSNTASNTPNDNDSLSFAISTIIFTFVSKKFSIDPTLNLVLCQTLKKIIKDALDGHFLLKELLLDPYIICSVFIFVMWYYFQNTIVLYFEHFIAINNITFFSNDEFSIVLSDPTDLIDFDNYVSENSDFYSKPKIIERITLDIEDKQKEYITRYIPNLERITFDDRNFNLQGSYYWEKATTSIENQNDRYNDRNAPTTKNKSNYRLLISIKKNKLIDAHKYIQLIKNKNNYYSVRLYEKIDIKQYLTYIQINQDFFQKATIVEKRFEQSVQTGSEDTIYYDRNGMPRSSGVQADGEMIFYVPNKEKIYFTDKNFNIDGYYYWEKLIEEQKTKRRFDSEISESKKSILVICVNKKNISDIYTYLEKINKYVSDNNSKIILYHMKTFKKTIAGKKSKQSSNTFFDDNDMCDTRNDGSDPFNNKKKTNVTQPYPSQSKSASYDCFDMYEAHEQLENQSYMIYDGKKESIAVLKTKFIDTFFHPAKDQLWNTILNIDQFPEKFYALGQCPRIGLLLYGPPGSGKSSFAYRIARALNRHIISIDIKTLSKTELYSLIKRPRINGLQYEPNKIIYVFDEIDIALKYLYINSHDKQLINKKNINLLNDNVNKLLKNSQSVNSSFKDDDLKDLTNSIIDDTNTDSNYIDETQSMSLYNNHNASVNENHDKICLDDLLEVFQGPVPIDGSIFVATTNKYDEIKNFCPQLFRSGRLTPIYFGYPDLEMLNMISQYYFKKNIICDNYKPVQTSHIMELIIESMFDPSKGFAYFNKQIVETNKKN
jgi:hypothetical protein